METYDTTMINNGRKNPNDIKKDIGDEPFPFRTVQLKVRRSYPSSPQILSKGRSIIPEESIQTMATMIQVRFFEKRVILAGQKIRTKRLTEIMAMLKAETPMLAKKKKENRGQE